MLLGIQQLMLVVGGTVCPHDASCPTIRKLP